jgi:hypothetical protein
MPSRLGVAAIILFWIVATGTVIVREVMRSLAPDAPPTAFIDLSDEATLRLPAQWSIFAGDKRIGTLQSQLSYRTDAESFSFKSTYTHLKIPTAGLIITTNKLTITTDITRDGILIGQRVMGDIAISGGLLGSLALTARIQTVGEVSGGVMTGRCTVDSDFITLDEPLDAVTVPSGQVLHPLQPLNRLRGVVPGQSFLIREVNPLRDAIRLMIRKWLKNQGASSLLPDADDAPVEYLATVRAAPEMLTIRGATIACYVIDYRAGDITATTWVSTIGGKVLRQDAGGLGESLSFHRDD